MLLMTVSVLQIPGSRNQYDSVFHALYKISKTEGLKGLYRYYYLNLAITIYISIRRKYLIAETRSTI